MTLAGIRITLVEDVTSVIRGSQDVSRSFERNADALDDLAREAQQAGRTTGTAISDGAEQGEDAVVRLERSFLDMTRDVSRQSRAVGDDVGDNTRRGFREAEQAAEKFGDTAAREGDRASETTQEFRDEARSNFSEVASSFQGDMTSATDLVQGTLGGLAGSIPGGLGLALGGLAAVAGTFAAKWQQAAEDTKERIGEMYDDMVESGNDFLSESAIQQGIRKILLDEAGRVTDYAKAMDIAKVSGLDLAVVLRGLGGDQEANAATQAALRQAIEDGEKAFDAARESGEDYNELLGDTQNINAYIGLLERQAGEFDTAAGKADVAREATTEWDETLRGLPREIRTQLGLSRDVANEQEARAAYDGLGRPITTDVAVRVDMSEAERQIRRFTDKSYVVNVNGRVAGMRYE